MVEDDNKTETSKLKKMSQLEKRRRYALTLYALTTVFLFADQNLLAPNLSAAASEFGFDDIQRDVKLGGDIALAFFLLGAPASFLVGCMADTDIHLNCGNRGSGCSKITVGRSMIFGIVIIIGEGSCMVTYFTTTYRALYITRALTGFSVGGALPLLSSILGDWYPPEKRSSVMALVGMGTGFGIALGQGVSGFLGPRFGWRLPFLVVSLPAVILGILILLTVQDPVRGACEAAVLKYDLEEEEKREILQNRDSFSSIAGDSNTEEIQKTLDDHNEVEDYHALRSDDKQEARGKNDAQSYVPTYGLFQDVQTSTINLSQCQEKASNSVAPAKETFSQCESATKPKSNYYQEGGNEKDDNLNRQHSLFCYKILKSPTCTQNLKTSKSLLTTPTVILTLLQGAPGCIPWGIVNTYLNDYLSADCHLSVQVATSIILLFGIGNFFGLLVGGIGGDYLHKKRGGRYPPLLAGSMAIFGCFPMWILINANFLIKNDRDNEDIADGDNKTSLTTVLFMIFISLLAGLGSGVTGPIVKSTLQNVTLPNERGQAFAMLNTFDDFGRGLGPVFVAKLIEGLDGERRQAFNIGVAGWILCGLVNLGIFWTVELDEERVARILLAKHRANLALHDDEDGINVDRARVETFDGLTDFDGKTYEMGNEVNIHHNQQDQESKIILEMDILSPYHN